MHAYQINGKTVAIFFAVYTVRSTRTVFFFCSGFVRDIFERVEEKATRSLFCKSERHLLVKMRESVSRATFSSTVQPYLVDGTAVLVN